MCGLVERRLGAAVQPTEVDDVVGEEARHRRRRPVPGGVVRRGDLVVEQVCVRRRVDRAEQLRVDVRVLLARVRIGQAHDPVGVSPVDVRVDDGAVRGRVAVRPERQPLERLAVREGVLRVQIAEQIVEGAVLAHHHDDVVEARCAARAQPGVRIGHGREPASAARRHAGADRRTARAADHGSGDGRSAHLEEAAPGRLLSGFGRCVRLARRAAFGGRAGGGGVVVDHEAILCAHRMFTWVNG